MDLSVDLDAGAAGLGMGAEREERTTRDVIWSFVFSYGLAFVLIAALIAAAGFWPVLGYTRLLDIMVRSGLVQLHDGQLGLIEGRQDLESWFASQEPIDWGLLSVASIVLLLAWAIMAVQFHGISKFCGVENTLGQSVRASLYGRGVNMFLPFNAGKVATASALEGQGAPLNRAALAGFTADFFLAFQLLVFGIIGIVYLGWTTWLQLLFWGLVIVGSAYLLTNGKWRRSRMLAEGAWPSAKGLMNALFSDPIIVVRLGALSLLAFALEVTVVYMISQAFTTDVVVLLVEPPQVMMGLLGGYLASLFKITPGGIGQFEWGFTAALFLGGLGLPEAVTLVMLYLAMRYLVGGIMFGVVTLAYGVETDMGSVLAVFKKRPAPLQEAV